MQLSPRLSRIAEEVPDRALFVDVGTDHAYLPVRLLQTGKIARAIATDLRRGPLERARKTAQQYNVSEKISFRLCDGLSGVSPEEADTIAIAGMGGETIAEILGKACWTRETGRLLLLQPMSSIPELRVWLQSNGFDIKREHVVCEGRAYYIVMIVRGGSMPPLTPAERWAGRQCRAAADPNRAGYLDDLARRLKRALTEMERSQRPGAAERRSELRNVAEDLEKMKEEWNAWQR